MLHTGQRALSSLRSCREFRQATVLSGSNIMEEEALRRIKSSKMRAAVVDDGCNNCLWSWRATEKGDCR